LGVWICIINKFGKAELKMSLVCGGQKARKVTVYFVLWLLVNLRLCLVIPFVIWYAVLLRADLETLCVFSIWKV